MAGSSSERNGAGDAEALDAQRFRALSDDAQYLITEVDARGRVLYVSRRGAQDLGGDPEAADRFFGLPRVHPDDREDTRRVVAQLFDGRDHVRATFRIVEPDGAVRWVELSGTRVVRDDGEVRGLLLHTDITRARQAEDQLAASLERFRLIAENAYDLIAEFDADGNTLFTNSRVAHLLGPQLSDAADAVVHPEDLKQVAQAFTATRDRGETPVLTYRVVGRSGAWRQVEARFQRVVDSEGRVRIIGVGRDLTERIEAEQRLIESERRYRQLVERSPLGILVAQDGTFVFSNLAGAQVCGARSPQELVGVRVTELLSEADLVSMRDRVHRAMAGEKVQNHAELRLLGLDGKVREVFATGSTIEYQGRPAYQGLVRDVTELRRAEREGKRLELQLQEARKLESLGLLAGGIAHDFNNLLAVILGNSRYAHRHADAHPDCSEALADVIEAAEQAARLTHQLLAYAGRRSPEVRTASLNDLVNANAGLLASAVPRHARLSVELADELPQVRADVVQIEQVLMNLVLNACDALEHEDGSVRVRTGCTHVGADEIAGWVGGSELPAGPYVYLEVSDTGRGMDAATRSRIFEPFFTTKPTGHGLGLAAVLGLVGGHGGGIALETAPGQGTRVRVYLPALDDALPEAPLRGPDIHAALVIDPDPRRRAPIEDLLRELGVGVIEATGVRDALEQLRLAGAEIGLAVCPADASTTLPGAGWLPEALRRERPDLPLLLTNGDERDAYVRRLVRDAPTHVVHADADREQLRRRLEALVGKP